MGLDVYSVLPPFLFIPLILWLVSIDLFKRAETPLSMGHRLNTIDGLRGYLGLAVFFHHAAINRGFIMGGAWLSPPSRFYVLLGEGSVAIFFMITAYLFWTEMIECGGRTDWINFYIKRSFRIVPLYIIAVAIMMSIVAIRSGFQPHVPLRQLFEEIGAWLAFGLFSGDLNGIDARQILAYVTWSLHYEWLFYLVLPLAAIATRHAKAHFWFAVACLMLALVLKATTGSSISAYVALFCIGIACASAKASGFVVKGLSVRIRSIAVLILLAGLLFARLSVYTVGPVLVIGAAFFLIVSDTDIFGALTFGPARRLGAVSYGLYILQGLVINLVFAPEAVRRIASTSALSYWCLVFLCAVLLTVSAYIAHLAVERPFRALGRRAGLILKRVPEKLIDLSGTRSITLKKSEFLPLG